MPVGISARKNKLVMNWYTVAYVMMPLILFFNAILSRLIVLKDIKKPKEFGVLLLETPTGICPIPYTITSQLPFTLQNSIFFHKMDIS